MSDIFLSYAMEDRSKAAKVAAVFEQQDWNVWWDPSTITPGEDYIRFAMKELEKAKVVVLLWSRAAREARLTQEALKHARQNSLFLVLLEEVEPPPKIKPIQTFNFSNWNNMMAHFGLMSLARHVRVIIAIAHAQPSSTLSGSFKELSPSEIQESARYAAQEATGARSGVEKRFSGVFISYRRSEAAAYAGRLYDRLAARFGKGKVFIDTENVGWGEDFVEAITEAAESCAVMIALISPRWARGAGGQGEVDDYVRLEVATALGRKIRVIPILIQGAAMPQPKELPEDLAPLARRNALALSDTRWERDVEDLMKTLEGLLKD